jgi:hypothetical protein
VNRTGSCVLVLALVCVLCVSLEGGRSAAEEPGTGKRIVLEGVDRYQVVEPLFEGVRVILSYRGESYSPAYVQGISGAAFRIAGPCPCAPTCSSAMTPVQLVELFGYEAEHLAVGGAYDADASLPGSGDAKRQARMRGALARIKDEIRANRPALLVHAFTNWEYDVVCGFDEEKGVLHGRGSYAGLDGYAEADQMRALGATAIGGGPYAVLIGEKTGEFDARAAELAALREAIAHAHRRSEKPLHEGLECYDLWINAYRHLGSFMGRESIPDDRYPLSILPSTRRAASQFMEELAEKYPEAKANLDMAGNHFAEEAEALTAAHYLRRAFEDEPSEDERVQVAGFLTRARAMYALAIGEVSRALSKIEARD